MQSNNQNSFIDAKFGENHFLTKTEAAKRFAMVSNVAYKLALALRTGGKTYHGMVTAHFDLASNADDTLCLDFKGQAVHELEINGAKVPYDQPIFEGHRIRLPGNLLKKGDRNQVNVWFEANYVTDCQGIHWFKDSEDGAEYVYANSEPDHSHVWFPNFDQPDLKAAYELLVITPKDWIAVANAQQIACDDESAKKDF